MKCWYSVEIGNSLWVSQEATCKSLESLQFWPDIETASLSYLLFLYKCIQSFYQVLKRSSAHPMDSLTLFWKIGRCRYTLGQKFWSQFHSSYSNVNTAAHCTQSLTFVQEPLLSGAKNSTSIQHQGYSRFIILVLLCVSSV
jgi:hypothetical protein